MTIRPAIDRFKRATARRLRHNSTGAETILWRHLRRLETHGTHFRRQVPIGKFIVDFTCMAARLIVEVDGSQHGETPVASRDRQRTQWLEAEGYRVMRFWNNEVMRDSRGVMDAIYAELYGNAVPRSLIHNRRKRTSDVS